MRGEYLTPLGGLVPNSFTATNNIPIQTIPKTSHNMPYYFLIALFILFLSCSDKKESKKTIKKNIEYLYSYDPNSDSDTSVGFFFMLNNSHEESLNLYADLDSFYRIIPEKVYYFIFELHNNKFAITVDSTTKIYKFGLNKFDKILTIPSGLWSESKIKIDTIDINADGFNDILLPLDLASICLFYHPEKKTLVYDYQSDLRNIQIDLKKKEATSFYRWSSAVFAIEQYSFRIKEETMSLWFNNPEAFIAYGCENIFVTKKFDKNGNIAKVDTIKVNCGTTKYKN